MKDSESVQLAAVFLFKSHTGSSLGQGLSLCYNTTKTITLKSSEDPFVIQAGLLKYLYFFLSKITNDIFK